MLMFSQDKFIQSIYSNDVKDLILVFMHHHMLPEKYPHILQISSYFSLNNLWFLYRDTAFLNHDYHELCLS